MKNREFIIYLIGIVYSILILTAGILFENLIENNIIKEINTFTRVSLFSITTAFFFITVRTTNTKHNNSLTRIKKHIFYVSQIIIFLALTINSRFIFSSNTTNNNFIFILTIALIDIFIILNYGDYKNFKQRTKYKLLAIGILTVFYFIFVKFLQQTEYLIETVFIDLIRIWISLLFMLYGWDIMYGKIKSLKTISKKYYYKNNQFPEEL